MIAINPVQNFIASAVAVLMVLAAIAASALVPTQSLAVTKEQVLLKDIIPEKFGGWTLDPNVVSPVVNPQVQAVIDSIYEQTLSRTYSDENGSRVMLSIAYGATQSDSLKAHTPDVCYPAQGFTVLSKENGGISTGYGYLPVSRLVTSLGNRHEPLTYWIIVGDRVGATNFERKLIQLEYGFSGVIPDGLLVRVSSIDTDVTRAFQVQENFVNSLLAALDHAGRKRLAGLD